MRVRANKKEGRLDTRLEGLEQRADEEGYMTDEAIYGINIKGR